MENKGNSKGSTPQSKIKKKTNIAAIILAILFFLSTALNVFLFRENFQQREELSECANEIDDGILERERIIASLNEMDAQYTELSEQHSHMREELLEEKEKIQKLIEQAKNKNWTIAKLQKETSTLREIMKGYLVTIDSLNTLNQNLIVENMNVKNSLSEISEKNQELSSAKSNLEEKVKIGSILQVNNVQISAQNVKTSGKYKETDRASRTEVIKSCFTIAENKIAQAGKRNIYMRIISPFGAILDSKSDNSFEVKGRKSVFTHVREVDYQNETMEVCLYWEVGEDDVISKGKYIVQLYTDGVELGSYALTLK